MAKIRVICGGCGIVYKDANGITRHVCRTAESGTFECDDAQAERLVRIGVAEYATVARPAQEKPGNNTGENIQEPENTQKTENTQDSEKIKGHLDAVGLETWDYNELKKLVAEMGVEPKSKKKADLIAAIVAVEIEADTDDEPPELNTADPV